MLHMIGCRRLMSQRTFAAVAQLAGGRGISSGRHRCLSTLNHLTDSAGPLLAEPFGPNCDVMLCAGSFGMLSVEDLLELEGWDDASCLPDTRRRRGDRTTLLLDALAAD